MNKISIARELEPVDLPTPAARPRQVRETLVGLQGLRGLAAILVICDHAICTMNSKAGGEADGDFAWYLGWLGVKIFFTISGFTMILAHGKDFRKAGAVRKFTIRRLGRIVPLYWITSLIYYAKLMLAHSAPGIVAFLLSMFFIPHLEPGRPLVLYGRPFYELGWTLEYEMFFYLMFGLALFAPRRIALIGLTLFFAGLTAGVNWSVHEGLLHEATIVAYLGAPIVLFFVLGIGIGVLRDIVESRKCYPWGFWMSVAISSLAILAATAAGLYFGSDSGIAAVSATIAAMVSVLACGLAQPEPVNGPARKLAKVLGDSTYAIYLTHSFIVGPAGSLTGKFAHGLPTWLFVVAIVPICAYVGWLVYKFVDGPASKWFGTRMELLSARTVSNSQS